MLEDHGRPSGYDNGYRDAAQNKREKPSPSLGASLLSPSYLDAYTKAYHQGYAQAERDIVAVRRATVVREMRAQSQQQEPDVKHEDQLTALLRNRLKREQSRTRDRDGDHNRNER